VNFWASWCYPACYEEAPLVEATWRKYKGQGLVMLGVVIQDKEPNAREFMRRFNYTFPNGPDPGSKISIDFGVYGVPETFFIDRQGRIAYKHVGVLGPDLMEAQVQTLLKG
jgi:cytochrome c biogenesis protein CcmG/thiol:disulfide interchange protein DsbE